MILNFMEHFHGPLAVDQIDSQSWLAEASGASDSVQIRLAVGAAALVDGQVEIDDDRHLKLPKKK